nr:MAG TPA: hypothetical protein [Caudoviricetes sp.]
MIELYGKLAYCKGIQLPLLHGASRPFFLLSRLLLFRHPKGATLLRCRQGIARP